MGKGYIEVTVTTALGLLPVEGASVVITKHNNDDSNKIIGFSETNSIGKSVPIAIEAPDAELSRNSGNKEPFAVCDIHIKHINYNDVLIENVQIFDGIKTIQIVDLLPLKGDQQSGEQTVIITPQNL